MEDPAAYEAVLGVRSPVTIEVLPPKHKLTRVTQIERQ